MTQIKKLVLFFGFLGVALNVNATEKILGAVGGSGRWVKIARIQNQNPIAGGECSSFSGSLNLQTDFGQSGTEQYYAIFSFGSRGGLKPLLQEYGEAVNRPVTDLSRVEWRIYEDAQGWHYLWFWQSDYSRYAAFDYQTVCGTEYWSFEDPPSNFTQLWSSLDGDRQYQANSTSRVDIKNPVGGLGMTMENGGKVWNFSIENNGNSLFVNNSTNPTSFFTYTNSGRFGIGTTTPDSELSVNGNIHAKEVTIDLIGWPDYVFTEEYTLPTLEGVRTHIQEKGHLPHMPSAKEVAENGVELGEMNKLLLEKIEELTLYILKQDKALQQQETINQQLEARLSKLEN
ncbi:MAG: hypothetical protein AAGF77_14935 [Bacteroidota bacterium]